METCKFSTKILVFFYKKWPWQNGSTLASHARGPGFKSWARQSFLLLLNTSKSDKNVETRKINKSADVISSFIQKEKTLGMYLFRNTWRRLNTFLIKHVWKGLGMNIFIIQVPKYFM